MGRGVSSGGGQSSLGYLFGSGETAANNPKPAENIAQEASSRPAEKPNVPSQPVDNTKQIPAGIPKSSTNNYLRADGQNTGNFLTVWFS